MKEDISFYQCPVCGNIVELIEGDMAHVICCGKSMEKMVANITDAAAEKHIPVYEKYENEIIVKVGEVFHPMEKEHYIMWIAQVTERGIVKSYLQPGEVAETKFVYIPGAQLYAYCNKHGLWKMSVE